MDAKQCSKCHKSKALSEFHKCNRVEVGRIIPLRGRNVSGLRVASNLQYLTRSESSSKGNKFGGL